MLENIQKSNMGDYVKAALQISLDNYMALQQGPRTVHKIWLQMMRAQERKVSVAQQHWQTLDAQDKTLCVEIAKQLLQEFIEFHISE